MAVAGSLTYDTEIDKKGFDKGLNNIANIGKTALKGVAAATTAVAAAFGTLVVESVKARGELEQQIGGVKKLFSNEFGDASQQVIENANKAYKTAGLSAIQYMQTVTGFSASLISSLGGDTVKASAIADRAIKDMSDNANTFGTDISLIQNAYQGFAKQNYTMLDNLKLGYGGTKTEMERLVSDASKLTDIQKELNVEVKDGDLSFANIAQAISVVQQNLGILGTTEMEASYTLQGSLSSMKAAWENFLSGSGGLGEVVETVSDVVENVVRIISEALPQIIDNIVEYLPELAILGGEILTELIDGIIKYLPQLTQTAVSIMQQLITGIVNNLPTILETGIQVLTQFILRNSSNVATAYSYSD